ncbi:hypothetical protein EV175_004307, partial [Coemansia sp. RSA 1933]
MGPKDGYYSETSVHSNDSDDSGELWITPKVPSRVSTHIEKPRSNTLPTQIPPLELRHIRSATEATTTASVENDPLQLRRQLMAQSPPSAPHFRRRTGAIRDASNSDKLTPMQMVAWYAPRILFLFLVGWSCSIGVQLIHAQQRSLDATGPIGATFIRPFVQQQQPANNRYAEVSGGRTSLPTGAADAGDSDTDSDSDTDAYYRHGQGRRSNAVAGGKRNAARQGSSALSRDLIGRVLEHASWSDGISGAMSIAVGLAYPYLDWKWQSYVAHKVEWNDVLRCAGGFLGINYAALKLPFESANQSSLIMVIISLGLWTVCDGTLHGLLLSTSTSLMATWLLHMHALSNYASFTQDDYQGLLSYLPSVLFTYCVMVGSIGRRLGHHP